MREIAIATDRISASEKPEYRKRTFNDALAALTRAKIIVCDDDRVSRDLPVASYDYDEGDDI